MEGVSACDEDVEVGMLLPKNADVALHLEAYTVDCRGEHVGAGVVAHQFGIGSGLYLRKESCVLMHGIKPQLHTGGDDSAQEAAICRDEVVGDASAGIDDEEGVVGVLDDSSYVCCPTVCAVTLWNGGKGLDRTGCGGCETDDGDGECSSGSSAATVESRRSAMG